MVPVTTGQSAVILADPHFRHGESFADLARIEAFARFCLKHRFSIIICLGDWFDFTSCADYLSPKAREGKTVRKDLEAGLLALKMLHAIWDNYNKAQRRAGRSHMQYNPRCVLLKGNHDIRPAKKGAEDPTLSDEYTERYIDQDFLEKKWEVYQFLEVFKWQGVRFSHYFKSGAMGKACGISQAIAKIGRSAVWGHTHRFQLLNRQVEKNGPRDIVVSAPAFIPDWRLDKDEQNGILVLTDVEGGEFATSHISYDYLMNNYSQNGNGLRSAA